jgi:hypothetical protein
MRPLQTLANLTASLRERDYAVRGRHARKDDALGLAQVFRPVGHEDVRPETSKRETHGVKVPHAVVDHGDHLPFAAYHCARAA